MKVIVTGGAGYIGSHAVLQLLDSGHEVIVIDNLSTGHRDSIDKRAIFYEGDIRDGVFLDKVMNEHRADGIMHFAAKSLVSESMEQPMLYFDNNVYGSQVLIEAMIKNKIKYFVLSSTAATYGNPEYVPIDEEHPTNPINPYGESKRMIEKILKWAEKAHGIKFVSLRYFNVAGAHHSGKIGELHEPETHLMPIVLQVPLNKRKELHIFGDDYNTKDGSCIRDYIHVEDLIDAHILAIEKLISGMNSEIINLGTGCGYSNFEIVEAARKVTGHPIPYSVKGRRPGDPDILVASNEKAKRILGWTPLRENVELMIKSAFDFHKNH